MWTDALRPYLIPCPSKTIFGVRCFGCGFQTSLLALLEGDIKESIALYPALIPILILFLLMIIQVFVKQSKGQQLLRYWFYFCVVLAIGNYVAGFFQ